MAEMIEWQIDLTGLIDQQVRIETKEGFRRDGKLTGINFAEVRLNGDRVEYPTEIMLNGDDLIPFDQLVTVSVI